MNRRLSAILAADVVSYSALMEADQERTLAALRQLRSEVFGPAVAGHRGKVVKSMGDGWLVEFTSAVDAVTCAMQVQDRLAGHEIIRLRIGIHIGDVMHEEEDVYGDGVNVAARLEALAEPGAVAISDAVHGTLDGTLRPSFDDQGEQRLKNIDRAVRIWGRGGRIAKAEQPKTGTAITLLDLVPVATSDTRDDVRELADAITHDLFAYLSSMRWTRLRVTGETDQHAYVLRPVLRARGDRVRLELWLSAPGDAEHWTQRYDGDLSDSFDWQDETVATAASYLSGVIQDQEIQRLEALPIDQLSAEEALALAEAIFWGPNPDFERTAPLIEHAVQCAPHWATPYSDGVLFYYASVTAHSPVLADRWKNRIEDWFERARALPMDDPGLSIALELASHMRSPDPARMQRSIVLALRSAPFDRMVLTYCAWGHLFLGEPEEGEACMRKSLAFTEPSRQTAANVNGLAFAAVQSGRYEEAITHARRALAIAPNWPPAARALASAGGHLGDADVVREALAILEAAQPGDTVAEIRRRGGYIDNPCTRRFFDGLRLAGIPEGEP